MFKLFAILLLGFSKVHIGGASGHDYRIVLTETGYVDTLESGTYTRSQDLSGQFFIQKREIHIRPTLELREMQRVLTHEIFMHGCFLESKLHDFEDHDEDEVANSLDQCLSDTIHDNPKLIQFLQQQR